MRCQSDLSLQTSLSHFFTDLFLLSRQTMLLKASKSDPPVGAIIVGQVTKNCMVKWEAETSLDIGDGVLLNTGASIIRSVIS